jgi:Outer membrane protein beta-barrel domain
VDKLPVFGEGKRSFSQAQKSLLLAYLWAMKKYVLLGLALVMSIGLRAQNVGAGLLAAGVASQIDGDSWGGYNKLGYSLGGFAWYDFDDRLSLMPEITYNHRGSREVVVGYGQYNLNMIDVPVLLRYRIYGKPETKSLLVEVGPSANILLGAKGGFGGQKIDLMPNFHRLGVSGTGGATFFINRNIGIFGRWTYSLTNLNTYARLSREYWRCHFITFGLKFALK